MLIFCTRLHELGTSINSLDSFSRLSIWPFMVCSGIPAQAPLAAWLGLELALQLIHLCRRGSLSEEQSGGPGTTWSPARQKEAPQVCARRVTRMQALQHQRVGLFCLFSAVFAQDCRVLTAAAHTLKAASGPGLSS